MSTKVLVGYWPLLNSWDIMGPGDTTEDIEGTLKRLDDIEIPPVMGVMWMQSEDGFMPVFVMERAEDIACHLTMWCEEDYSRFVVCIDERDNGYAIALIPDCEKSIERWKLARLVFHTEISVDDEFVVYYKIIGTCCINGATYKHVKDKLSGSIMVGFIDIDDIDKDNISSFDTDKICMVGPFNIANLTEQHKKHMDMLFEDATEVVKSKLTS